MSRENMNRFHEQRERELLGDLERLCRMLPKAEITPTIRFSKNIPLFNPIHEILAKLDRLRSMVLVPVKNHDRP